MDLFKEVHLAKKLTATILVGVVGFITLMTACSNPQKTNSRSIASTLNPDDVSHHNTAEWRSYFKQPPDDETEDEND